MYTKFLLLLLVTVITASSFCPPTKRIGIGPLVKQGVPRRNILCPWKEGEKRPLYNTEGASCGTLCWKRQTDEGYRIHISGTVKSSDCEPIPDAAVYIWATDGYGSYGSVYPDFHDGDCSGITQTDKEGKYWFETDRPGTYGMGFFLPHDIPPWGPQHLHFAVYAPGYKFLGTQVFFAGDAARGHDIREISFTGNTTVNLGSIDEELEVNPTGDGHVKYIQHDFVLEPNDDPVSKHLTFEQALLGRCTNDSEVFDVPIYPMLCYPDQWKKIVTFVPPVASLLVLFSIWSCYRRVFGSSKGVQHKTKKD